MNCYSLFYIKKDWIGVAESIDRSVSFQLLYGKGAIENWRVLYFEMTDGALVDYQPNDLGFALCSCSFRACIDAHLMGNEAIQWLPAVLRTKMSEERYWILHVYRRDDVISKMESIFAADHLVKPVLARETVAALKSAVFASPYDWVRTYVVQTVKTGAEEAKLSGVKFLKVPQI